MNYDSAWKRLFGHPVVVEHLLRGFAGPATERLDFTTLDTRSASWVGADAEQRHGDAAWRVDYGDGSKRSLVVLLEFQSGIDQSMAARTLRYASMAYEAAQRQEKLDEDGELRLLPVVVYSGNPAWSAPGGARSVDLGADGEALMPLRSPYLLLDAQRLPADDTAKRNIVSAVFEATAAKGPEGMSCLASLWTWLPGEVGADRCRAAMEVVADWVLIATGKPPDSDEGLELRRMLLNEETTMHGLEERLKQQREGWIQHGEERGIERGIERGLAAERDLLRRQARRKFDAPTAEALARHLDAVTDDTRLAEAGELIIDCETGADLLDRVGAV